MMIVVDTAVVTTAMAVIVSPAVGSISVSGGRRRRRHRPLGGDGSGGGGGVVIFFALESVDGRFVTTDSAELIAHDSQDEEAVEYGDDGQHDGMQHFGLLRLDVSRHRIQDPRGED